MAVEKIFKPKIIGFLCNWCCYGGADLCGVSRFQYPPYLRVIRIMCSGRVDLKFLLKAFLNGADGVFVGGCHLNDCHYNPEGNYDALVLSKIFKRLMPHIGIDPARFRLEWVSAGEGIRFAEIMNAFSDTIKTLGPLGSSENIAPETLSFNIEAAMRLVPFMKLVERERMRVPIQSEAEYEKYFASGTLDRLFDEIIPDKFTMSRMVALLADQSLSAGEIAEHLALSPSDLSRHLALSSKQGFIRYDTDCQRYTAA